MGALLLGLVQGFTEFLPISSSGHLILVRTLLGIGSPGATLEVWLHGATLVSVVVGLRARLWRLVRGVVQGRADALRLAALIALGTLPAGVAGLFLRDRVELLFSPAVAALGFLLTTALLWTAPTTSDGDRPLARLRAADALLVGALQALALLPGLSRSASTMAAARWCGIKPADAAEFSFLLALPAIVGALVLTGAPPASLAPTTLIAALAAGTAGVLAVQWAIQGITKPRWWKGFGAYTLILAGVSWWVGR